MKEKNPKNFGEYYIGLDMGTDSVGWAVTDTNYKLLRVNNKSLWGVRLFDTAQSAKERRLFRAARRRLQRRKQRLHLLREIFAPVINDVDPNFFARLADSNLYDGDKRENTWFSLFNDSNFNDRDFHRKYKTVYHLRKAMTEEVDPDPRLVYLALHHIIKNRGHFLVEGGMDAIDDISVLLDTINEYLSEHDCEQFCGNRISDFKRLLVTLNCGKKARSEQYIDCFGVKNNKQLCAILKLIAGNTVKVKDLPCNVDDNVDEKESLSLDCDWDAQQEKLREIFNDDFVLIENAKLLYDYAQLKKLLGEHATLSEAMVAKYDKHNKDLALLKKVLRRYGTQKDYDDMFKSAPNGKCNYTAYSGTARFGKHDSNADKKKYTVSKLTSYDDFRKYVKEVLQPISEQHDDEDVRYILNELENGTFLPKQVSKSNATIPYQLNEMELCAILNNVRKYPKFAFLNQCDENGMDNAEKIRKILVFRIPYFVGPTNNHSGKYWLVRKADGKILPWNLESKVDLDRTERNFVQRLTLDCPYVEGEKVLPRCSLLYEEYVFLNTAANIRVNREPLTAEQKEMLSTYFAQTGASKLTAKMLRQWLRDNNFISDEEVDLAGFNDDATTGRRTYYQFVKILGGADRVEKYREQVEKIIFDMTVCSDEKERLRKHLKKTYDFLTEQQIKAIVGLTVKGWGRCSAKFLTMRVGINPDTGEVDSFSVIDAMRSTKYNFEEVYNKYGFKNYFERLSANERSGYALVDELYCSPAVKKQIRQALNVVKELRSLLGSDPKKIFVEVARDKKSDKEKDLEERKLSKSRFIQLRERLFGEAKSLFVPDDDVKDKLEEMEANPRQLNRTNLFLYFLQNGKDIYTGERIDYNQLSQNYDHDHIYPRSQVKDDSILNNLVLTARQINSNKTNEFPVRKEIQDKMLPFWTSLRMQGLMTAEKFYRLTRKTPLTDEEIMAFVNKQLVETRQSTKETIKLLKSLFPNTEVVYSKATLVSEFRAKQIDVPSVDPVTGEIGTKRVPQFVKCREINDLHHAKDAYLNIVVGNVYNTRYGHNAQFMREGVDRGPSDANIYDYNVGSDRAPAWIAGKDGTIAQVAKVMHSNTPLYTAESYVKSGALFDATVYSKSKDLIPLKGALSDNEKFSRMSDTEKYGGYDSESRVYFMLVKYAEKKSTKKGVNVVEKYRLLGVTARYAAQLESDDARTEYCRNCGLNEPIVLIPKIKIGAFFRFDKTLLALSGMTGERIIWRLAQQNTQSEDVERYLKKIYNVLEDKKKAEKMDIRFVLNERDGINAQLNRAMYDLFVSTLLSDKYSGASSLVSFGNKLIDLREKFLDLSLTDQCLALAEIAKVLQCNRLNADLTVIDKTAGKSCGTILTSSTFDLDSLRNIKIVYRSVTGVFEQQIPLIDFDIGASNK